MTSDRIFNHYLICAVILFLGLGLAFALPWLANEQGFAAQSEVGEQSNAPEAITTTYYVAIIGTGLNPTVDWSGAFTNVQDALVVAVEPSEIWVAMGVYYPDVGSGQINDSVTATFLMTDGVSIFGGFTFGDSDINDRDWENNLTVLSGDVDGDDTHTDGVVLTTTDIVDFNAYHVVTAIGVSSTAKLDGFTITAGQAGGTGYPNNIGGGFYCDGFGVGKKCSPSLKNVIFSGNSADEVGGAMFNNGEEDGDSSPSLTNVAFSGNSAVYNGGAMYNDGYNGDSNPSLTNVTFSGNSAGYEGGAMFNDGNDTGNSNPNLTNVAFSGNSAIYNGGAMFNDGSYGGTSSPTLTNVTFSGNSAGEEGGAMYNHGKNNGTCSPQVRNSIVWNNQADGVTGTITATIYNLTATITLSYSLVEDSGGSGSWALDPTSYVDGGGNIDTDPMFVTPINPSTAPTITGNLRLQSGSPAIDAGDNDYVDVPTDLDGEVRIKDGNGDGTETVDMGAYEAKGYYQLSVTKTGAGSGQVTSSPAGIDCGDTCSLLLKEDSTITLMANPDGNSIFTGWGGACSGTADCVVTMDAAKSVTATFTLDTHDYYFPIIIK